jgi:diguanylate cyclase (GGDEF)-like protein/PAS domain S-box-containing protein
MTIKFHIARFLLFLSLFATLVSNAVSAANSQLDLTESERRWVRDNPSVSFTGDPNWLPYEAFDEEGQYIGIVSEHLQLISELTGIQFRMSPSETWTESTEKAKKGLVDILSETDDSDLRSHLIFTDSYLSNPIVIAMQNSENYVDAIEKIANKKIALIKDYGYASKIRRKYSDIQFVTVNDIQDGLIAVSTGKADALLCTLALCSYTISELGLNNVRVVGKTEFDTKLALGVQKHLTQLVSILNKAIASITPGQQQAILDSWIKQKYAAETDYTLVYQVIVIAVVLLGIAVLWNRRLSQEIDLRAATERELKSAQEVLRLAHQRQLLHRENNPLGVIEWSRDFKALYWNKAAETIFGYAKEDVIGKNAAQLIVPESARDAVASIWRQLLRRQGGERSSNENITKDGRAIFCEWYNTALVDQDGEVVGVTSLVNDVTEQKLTEEMVWKQANFDALTGLPNRNMFYDRLKQEVMKSNRAGLPLALLLVDLDEFKEVNDTLGHDVGDLLLQEAGRRIKACVRDSDTVARLGGDEFTIILPELHQESQIDKVAQKIIDSLAHEFHLRDEVVHISGSIGITLYPSDSDDIDTLLKLADQAMYEAKKHGKNCYSYFTPSLQEAAQNRLRLTKDLREALRTEQFEVYFQPIVDLNSGRIYKAEALVRWRHPDNGMVRPDMFIPIAENTGLIHAIGDWVFRESAHWARHWSERFDKDFQVSVNMSPVQFRVDDATFASNWLKCLERHALHGSNMVVEITEGLLLNVEPEVVNKLLWLRDTGIQVAVDDFGTGYSSLSYLQKFDIDYLKIDQAFIRNLGSDTNDIALSEAIIMMAHKLGLSVIAEGVESEVQASLLKSAGCDYVQGYLYSRPIRPEDLEVMLEQQGRNVRKVSRASV